MINLDFNPWLQRWPWDDIWPDTSWTLTSDVLASITIQQGIEKKRKTNEKWNSVGNVTTRPRIFCL